MFILHNPLCVPHNHLVYALLLNYRDMGRELSADVILDLDVFNLSSEKTVKKPPSKMSDGDCDEELDERCPLFWQPGKQGYYSLRPGSESDERLNAFRNVGRYLSHDEYH